MVGQPDTNEPDLGYQEEISPSTSTSAPRGCGRGRGQGSGHGGRTGAVRDVIDWKICAIQLCTRIYTL